MYLYNYYAILIQNVFAAGVLIYIKKCYNIGMIVFVYSIVPVCRRCGENVV